MTSLDNIVLCTLALGNMSTDDNLMDILYNTPDVFDTPMLKKKRNGTLLQIIFYIVLTKLK